MSQVTDQGVGSRVAEQKVAKPRRIRKTKMSSTNEVQRLHGWKLARRYVTLVIVLIVLVGPIIGPLMGAFKAPSESVFGPTATMLPQDWSLAAFHKLFADTNILVYIRNSLFVCALNVASALVFSTTGGYMLSRKGWRGRKLVMAFLMSALIFPFESIMLSLYSEVRAMGFYDHLIGVWLPGMVGPFHLFLMMAAFRGIPDEIEDAAFIDGAGEWKRFWKVMLPQTKGSLVIVGLTAFIFAWQDYLWPLLNIQSDENNTVMLGIARLQSDFGTDYRVVLAGAIVALLPILIVYFSSQKYFFKGIEEGGLKF
ncbi:carbohydrate ABC transporter permease [Trueperella sp.]|uniref:carbohydrate ABC transporter permease n=1 Tax=Trueperella sp. TaxID=2699835 RepID=UPI0026367F21|nr:carbohydrate ABC transporter permease [Trueperella sp.]